MGAKFTIGDKIKTTTSFFAFDIGTEMLVIDVIPFDTGDETKFKYECEFEYPLGGKARTILDEWGIERG